MVRWFDGTEWTPHAVSADEPRPDSVVETDWQPLTDEQLRRQEQFTEWDIDVPQGSEPRYNGGGGVGGWEANRLARLTMRAGGRGPVHASRWLIATTVVLVLLAWGDHRHRWWLGVAAGLFFVVAVVSEVRAIRERAHWRELGRSDDPPAAGGPRAVDRG